MLKELALLDRVVRIACVLGVAACGVVVDIGEPAPAGPTAEAPKPAVLAPRVPPGAAPAPAGHWDAVNPTMPTTLRAVTGDPAGKQLWFAGATGRIYRFDGASVAVAHQGPLDDDYYLAWASGTNDLWVSGARGEHGVTLHYDGTSWREEPGLGDRDVHALHGFGPNDVWFVAQDNALFHFDGTTARKAFQTTDPRILRTLWGASPRDIWAAGDNGILLHYDGVSWASVSLVTDEVERQNIHFFGVWGASTDNVWLAASFSGSAAFYHWDGKAWSSKGITSSGGTFGQPPSGRPERRGRGMWGMRRSGDTALIATRGGCVWERNEVASGGSVGWHKRGDSIIPASDVWSAGTDGMFLVGGTGVVTRLYGSPGSNGIGIPLYGEDFFPAERRPLDHVSVGEDGETWALATVDTCAKAIVRWSGTAWARVLGVPEGSCATVVRVRSASDVWVGLVEGTPVRPGRSELRHWNGHTWDRAVELPAVAKMVWDIDTASDGSVWATTAQNGTAYRLVGGSWSPELVPAGGENHYVNSVTVLSASDAWLTADDGYTGKVFRWDGTGLREVFKQSGFHPTQVRAAAPDAVFVAGTPSLHFDGHTWEALSIPVKASSVWARSRDEAWFSGYDASVALTNRREATGMIVQWQRVAGVGVTKTAATVSPELSAIAGHGSEGMAVGWDGVTLRFTVDAPSSGR